MAADSRPSRTPRTSVWLEDGTTGAKRRSGERRAAARRQGGSAKQGQQPALDLGSITAAAVRLLDAEGLAKFSMRRLASELGVTAMSVYWYVDSKDALLELALDAVQGEVPLPDPADESANWRDQLRQLAYGYRALFVEHPWLCQMFGNHLNVGPQATAFAEASTSVMRRTGLPARLLSGALYGLFYFVFGFATVESNWDARCREAGLTTDEYYAIVRSRLADRPEFEGSLDLRAEAGESGSVAEARDWDFAVALDCILAGIEAQCALLPSTTDGPTA
ncbi:TetR/AcrR family transcriptional regulator [Streptomyces oceani]|uniref:HTH tetR-type domain-containing protein n=1 Tax=Streptomyces oceani TaxID=1075402 RepID=A0A1E7JWF7_9ACTN|nr:TetR/AcrR family transcriptional regulator [Streptomyces oceani]OEU95994.1 hypothetical protein AN216_23005 [Streptomyces oceani]